MFEPQNNFQNKWKKLSRLEKKKQIYEILCTFFSSTNISMEFLFELKCSNPFSQIGNIPGTFSYTKSSMLLCPFLGSIKCEIPAILKRIFMIILCRLQTVHKYLRRKKSDFQVTQYLNLIDNKNINSQQKFVYRINYLHNYSMSISKKIYEERSILTL